MYEINSVSAPRRSHSISLFLFFFLLVAACGLSAADVSKAKTMPCALTDREAAGLNGDTSTDIRAVSDYKKTISRLLQAGKFEQLDTDRLLHLGFLWLVGKRRGIERGTVNLNIRT